MLVWDWNIPKRMYTENPLALSPIPPDSVTIDIMESDPEGSSVC